MNNCKPGIFRILAVLVTLASLVGCEDTGQADESPGDMHNEHATRDQATNTHQGDEYVKKTSEQHRDEEGLATVHLTQQQVELLTVEVGTAKGGEAGAVISAPATIRFDPDRTAQIGPRLEAKVVKVLVDLGDQVNAGDTVTEMDSVALGRAKAEHLTAKARLASAKATYQREQSLAKENISSEAELLEAEAAFREAQANQRAAYETLSLYGLSDEQIKTAGEAGQPLSRFMLKTSIAGVVQRRDFGPGQTVSAEQTPVHIVDDRQVWIMIDAFEKALPRLAEGLRVTFSTRALPKQRFEGEIDWVSRELDEKSRTLTVRAVAKNPQGQLRAGMAGTAAIHTASAAQYALVPVDAVQRIADREIVFVPGNEAGAYRALSVETGNEGNGFIEIRNGLQPGEPVVVAGAFDLMSALTAGSRSAAHSH